MEYSSHDRVEKLATVYEGDRFVKLGVQAVNPGQMFMPEMLEPWAFKCFLYGPSFEGEEMKFSFSCLYDEESILQPKHAR